MKFLVLAALLAVTAAEAYRGGYGGRGYGRGGYGQREAEPYRGYGGYGRGGYGRGYGKREADAEALIVGGYAGHALATPYGYGLGYSAGYPYSYSSLAYAAPYALGLGHYYGKRSADAEPRRGYGGGYGRGYGKREAEPYRGYGGYGRGGYGRGGRYYG